MPVQPLPHPIRRPRPMPQPGPYPTPQPNPVTYPTPVNGAYPSFPVHVTPVRFDGVNPFTGGVDSRNEQVNNTYYDPFRDASKNNGTRRFVRRPIYDSQGNVTGYQEGHVWTNSVTGVEHGELKNVTDNGLGGKHEQIQVNSVP